MSQTTSWTSTIAATATCLAVVACIAVASTVCLAQLSSQKIGIDDADIYLRYARNVAHGLGIVWNPGGERVEGCTSLLWMLLAAGAFMFGPRPEWLLHAAGCAFTAGATLVVAALLARTFAPSTPAKRAAAAAVALLWALASPWYLAWSTTTLMDAPLWGAALVASCAATLAFVRGPTAARAWMLGSLLVALSLARPEASLLSATFLAAGAVARRLRRAGGGEFDRRGARVIAAVVVANAALVLFRRLYFGEWLPNTYYAKVGAHLGYNLTAGAAYVGNFGVVCPAFLATAAIGAACGVAWIVRARRDPASPRVEALETAAFAGAAMLAGIGGALYVGGDHFSGGRILQPYWPFGLVALVAGAVSVGARWTAALAVAAGVAVLSYAIGPVSWRSLGETSRMQHEFRFAEMGRRQGLALNEIFAGVEKPTVGVIVAGGLPYAYEGPSFDLLGLNDREMAHATRDRRGVLYGHSAFDRETFFRRAPDLVMLIVDGVSIRVPKVPIDAWILDGLLRGIHLDPRLRERYVPVLLYTEGMALSDVALTALARRDFVSRLRGRVGLREVEW